MTLPYCFRPPENPLTAQARVYLGGPRGSVFLKFPKELDIEIIFFRKTRPLRPPTGECCG